MPTNLITGEPIAATAEKKGVNLLPELTRDIFKDEKREPSLKRDFDNELVFRPAPPEEPISQFMKKTAEFLGLRKTNEEKIAESQVIFAEAQILSKEKDIPIDNAIRFERQKREADVVGAIKVFGDVLTKIPAELKTSILKMHQGAEGASIVDNEGIQEIIRDAGTDSNKFVEDVWRQYGERKIFPGIPIKITDVAELPQNIGFSLTSMATGLAFGVPVAFAPFPGARVAAWGIGTAASGKAAFEMSTYEIMQMYLEFKNEEMIEAENRGITPKEEKKLKEAFNSDARKFGLWEAIPEALSNLAFATLLTAPLSKMVGTRLAGRMITRLSGIYGSELLTETVTEKGQSAIMQKAGLDPATEPITWKEAFKRIAPQTFLLTTLLAGTGAVAIKSKQQLMKSLRKEIGTDNPKFKKSVEAIDKLIEEQKVAKKEALASALAKEALEKKTGEPQALTIAEQRALEEVEIKKEITPEKIIAEIEKAPEIIKEPQIIADLKEITEKINTLKSEGKPVPDSLLKRQQAIIKSFEGGEVIDIEKAPPSVAKILGIEPADFVRVRETTLLKQRIKDIAKGAREGAIATKKEIKQTQTEVIDIIDKSGIEAKEKAKFIKTIKNIQTQDDLTRVSKETGLTVLKEIENRIEQARQRTEKTRLEAQIKRELKFTKPIKVGQKRIGKFDIETNRFFNEIRAFNKLNQAQAQAKLDAFPTEANTEIDLIKKRFLSLKANGREASVEIFNAVNEDIKRIKALGRQAKDTADFEKLLQRQERVDEALSSIDKVKFANKKTAITQIVNIYRKGFSNIFSMLNSIVGRELAETYNPELSESRRQTATFKTTLAMSEDVKKFYGEKEAFKALEKLSQKDYTLTDIEGLTIELTKLDIIDIYNSMKNDLGKTRYNNAFGEDQVLAILGDLSDTDKAFGDSMQETVQSYREAYNKRNIEITGRDAGLVQNYWPFTSEFEVSVLDDIRIQGETPSANRERSKSTKVIPVPRNAWLKAQKHIAQGEHVDKVSRDFETLKRLFNDRKVKHAIKTKFGDDVFSVLQSQIDNLSLNTQTQKIDAVSQAFGFAINNWVTSKIALNPSTYIRQLMSVGNYIELMPAGEWVDGFRKGILSPKETFKFMWKNAPFLETRFNRGFSEALATAIEGAERINGSWANYQRFLTALARSGDMTAIVYGGFPLVQSEITKGKKAGLSQAEATKKAFEIFEGATLKAQQSALSSSRSQFQNSKNPFARLFLAFKNTSNQYFRKMADAVISRANGDISAEQFRKTMLIYAVIQPILYAASGFLLKEAIKALGNLVFGRPGEDLEEIAEKLFLAIITQMAVAPVNAIPIIDDVAMAAIRKLTGQKVWKIFSTPLFDELETGGRVLLKKEVTAEDYLKATATILEPATAAPVKLFPRLFKHFIGDKKGSKGGPAI